MQIKNVMYNKSSSVLTYSLAEKLCKFKEKPIILCIGSDKVIADSLGPLVGHLLTTKHNIKTHVYGTLKKTVNAINIEFYYNYIKKTHKDKRLLVVDASLGLFEQMGSIMLKNKGIMPAVLNNCPVKRIGDIGIIGVVLEKGFRNQLLLKQTKLNLVYNMAEQIAETIAKAYVIAY